MKQPRIISKISQSFVNPAYYKVYLKESVVKAILFIMFISILFSIPNMILMTIEAKQSVTVFENIINSEDFPGFVYENGELNSLSGESFLYEIGNSVVMFDTVGDYSIADLSKYEIGFLLDKTYMSLYSYGTEKTKISYDSFLLGEAENSEITSLISDNLSAIYPLLIAAFIISTIGFTVFCTLFILITTLFQRNILNLKLSYGDCLKITLYSLVMPLTLYQILLLLPVIPGIVTLLILFFLSSRKITVTLRLIKSELTPPKES